MFYLSYKYTSIILRAEQSRAEQSRARYLDIAKGIGITLVVFGHLSERYQFLRILVYSFHMPLFFIISGSLNKDSPLRQCLKNGMQKLVLPTYQILAFDLMLRILKSVLEHSQFPSLAELVNGLLIHGGVLWNAPVWFLMTLFACRLGKSLLSSLNNKIEVTFVIGCILVCLFNINVKFPSWWLTNVIMSFPFFWLGTKIKKYIVNTSNETSKTILIVLCLMWIIVAYLNGYTDINIQCNGRSYLLFLFTGISGTLIVIELSKWIEKLKIANVLEIVGKNSLIVLLTHYYICRGLIPYAIHFLKIGPNYIVQIVLTIIIVSIYYRVFSCFPHFLGQRKINTTKSSN